MSSKFGMLTPRRLAKRLRRLANAIEDGDLIVTKLDEKDRARPDDFRWGKFKIKYAHKPNPRG